MNYVAVGQLWTLMDSNRPRFTIRLTRIDGARVFGTLAGGTTRTLSLTALVNGRRGAHLLENADGSPAEEIPEKPSEPRLLEDTRTASDYVRPTKPRGFAPTNAKYVEALRMVRDGKTHQEIADRFGVSKKTIPCWIRNARDAEMDERNRKAG
jgi:DNA-directed RNA polymerase specialized sigma24 family protein